MNGNYAAGMVMVRAWAAGWRAARTGAPETACPYRWNAENAVERAQARMWLRGYDRGLGYHD